MRVSPSPFLLLLALLTLVFAPPSRGAEPPAVALPAGVTAVWDRAAAAFDRNDSRERICLNGLWQWQPADLQAEQVPAGAWGWFKVPGCWPGGSDYMQKDCQTVFAHPAWKDQKLGSLTAAWYQREITIPRSWQGRQIVAQVDCLNSYAAVFIDGKKVNELHFPAGEVDLTAACPPNTKHMLSMLVIAMPMKGVMLSYTDSAHAREVRGTVLRRGLCGDVWLASRPAGPRLGNVTVETSVRRKEITIDAALENLVPGKHYTLSVMLTRTVDERILHRQESAPFLPHSIQGGHFRFTFPGVPDERWDLHTPANLHEAHVRLREETRAVDEQLPVRFGFREFWIDGRDFFLNGSRIHLSAVPIDNAQISAALASYDGAKETLLRLKGIGINFVYTHHYGCEPGAHLALEEILRAADDVGMLVSVTQPHFSHYDWKAADADEKNGYAAHAAYYAQVAGSHPCVVAYAMSHNATGYDEDMNPDMIDGLHDSRDNWASKNVKLALRAEAIVERLDPSRIVYHHASGNLGTMHVINFYPNFVPVQELSDWFEHWSTVGVKPAFMCEYGAPFTWDWTMYRGWYQGKREFGSAVVPWEFCLAEWNALFVGDAAYRISDAEKANLRWEAKQMRTSNGWHRWDYPNQVGSDRFAEQYPIFAQYITDNWRAFRTWGVSAISPWEYGHYWKLRDDVDRRRKELPVDWEHLQRPGFSPDYLDGRMDSMDVAYERADWIPTPAAEALLRNNRPLLAYIAGPEAAVTSKDHNFLPGETVEKQLILINDSRERVTASWDCEAKVEGQTFFHFASRFFVEPGESNRQPIHVALPRELPPGRYELKAACTFAAGGPPQTDSFWINVLPAPKKVALPHAVRVFDPKGETMALLQRLGMAAEPFDAKVPLGPDDLLIIGKGALTTTDSAPAVKWLNGAHRMILLEQSADVLEKRFGFRIAEYGLRQVFANGAGADFRPDAIGLSPEDLRDWRGSATLQPPRLSYEMVPMHGPTVQWCGLPVAHLWRCGNRGNVASVTIEKPANGDFLSLLQGGYGLHYSALLRYRDAQSTILFCQMDVTGRTENDPVADGLVRNIFRYAAAWQEPARRQATYLGEPAGWEHLKATGIAARPYEGQLGPEEVLILGPGAAAQAHGQTAKIADWIKAGGHVLAVGLDQAGADALLPFKVSMKRAEHIAATFGDAPLPEPLRGVGPAEVYNRDPREMPLVTGGAKVFGDGVLAVSENGHVVLCQMVPWQFDVAKPPNLKRTHREASILLSRLLANMNVASTVPIRERLAQPVKAGETRWITGLYLDPPEEWDDPYRHFRW